MGGRWGWRLRFLNSNRQNTEPKKNTKYLPKIVLFTWPMWLSYNELDYELPMCKEATYGYSAWETKPVTIPSLACLPILCSHNPHSFCSLFLRLSHKFFSLCLYLLGLDFSVGYQGQSRVLPSMKAYWIANCAPLSYSCRPASLFLFLAVRSYENISVVVVIIKTHSKRIYTWRRYLHGRCLHGYANLEQSHRVWQRNLPVCVAGCASYFHTITTTQRLNFVW